MKRLNTRAISAIESSEADIACATVSARVSRRGHLRVHTFPVIAVHHLAPVLPHFLTRCPQITFDVLVTNRIDDTVVCAGPSSWHVTAGHCGLTILSIIHVCL
jgi:DNA-binding transcriptional LysR family regulator